MRTKPVFHCGVCAWLPLIVALTVPVALPQQWSLLTSGVPWGRYGHSAVYNAATNQIIVFGGVLSAPGILNTNDTWRMDNANGASGTPAWTLLLANGSPGGPAARHGHAAVYDAATDRMIVFGGCLGGCLPVANDVWVLVNATGAAGPPAGLSCCQVGGPAAPVAFTSTHTSLATGRQPALPLGSSSAR